MSRRPSRRSRHARRSHPRRCTRRSRTSARCSRRLIDVSMAGDDALVPILERAWVQDLRDEPDPRRRLQILARNGRLILERVAPIYERAAGRGGRRSRGSHRSGRSTRRSASHGQRELVRILAARRSSEQRVDRENGCRHPLRDRQPGDVSGCWSSTAAGLRIDSNAGTPIRWPSSCLLRAGRTSVGAPRSVGPRRLPSRSGAPGSP